MYMYIHALVYTCTCTHTTPHIHVHTCMYVHAHVPEEDVIHVFADVGAKSDELAVDAVQDGLQEVSLPRVLAVKQLQQLHHKRLIHIPLGQRRVQLRMLQQPQEEGVHQLCVCVCVCVVELKHTYMYMRTPTHTLHILYIQYIV